MADEEKPVADEQTTEVAEAAKSDTDETIEASDDSAAENSSAEEAIEAIAKNVQERASEIEDVLADVSAPTALPKAPSPAPSEPAPVVNPSEEDEPNLQISVGGDKVRISTAHPMIEEIAEQLHKSRQFTQYAVGSLCIALLAAVLFYVLMAAQLSSKVKEIDGMLGAMAKRTLQMTKGIETFSVLGRALGRDVWLIN